MGDRVPGGGLPLKKLIALSEPLSGNVGVYLDLVGPARDNLYREVRERD